MSDLLVQIEEAIHDQESFAPVDADGDDDNTEPNEPVEPPRELTTDERNDLETLFEQAKVDRSKAYELKRELDRLGVFAQFEDPFLDLFEKPDGSRD